MIDLNDNIVATLFITHYPGVTGNMNTLVDGKPRKFKYKKDKKDEANDPTEKRQSKMIKYLVNLGYL